MKRSQSAAPIKALVTEALDSLPRPLTDDVIDDVFFAIQQQPLWLKRYQDLCSERGLRGKWTVNTWGGFWIANAVDRTSTCQVRSVRNTLTQTYSKLDQPAPPKLSKKATEQAAGEALFAYYRANKQALPAEVSNVKEEILELIIDGLGPAEAFATALGIASQGDPKSAKEPGGALPPV